MKRLSLLSLLVMLTVMTATAQPGRYGYGRPSSHRNHPSYRSPYATPRSAYASRGSAFDVYYGLRLGMGVSTVNSDDRYLDGGSAKTGLNVGVVAGFQLAPATPFYLETGLYYAEKGGKGNYNGPFTYSLNYLEMPFVLKYQYNFDPITSIQPFVGVYGSLGVSGKIKDFDQRRAYSSFDEDAFQRCDGGLRLGCGLQFDHLYAEVGYDLGLANVSHEYFSDAHNGSLFLNVGLNF